MIEIDNKIVSLELFSEHFICDLGQCGGACCIHGDAGAPLSDQEAEQLESELDRILPFMRPEGLKAVDEQAAWTIDTDGEKVTPLVGKEECAYVIFEKGIAKCAVEKAWEAGQVEMQKPESCHLYPIRVNKLKNALALNYHRWAICDPARTLGREVGQPVFRFLEQAIKRAYGEAFFIEMESVYRELKKAGKL